MVKTYVISEIGINHLGDLDKAKKMISLSAEYGADAVKFQSYKTDNRVNKDSNLYEILKKCELSKIEQIELFKYAKKENVDFISTPFDIYNLEFLFDIDIDAIKISSFDIRNHFLLKKAYQLNKTKKKPIIISTGMSTLNNIKKAVNIIKDNYTLLHCVSSYPLEEENLNLSKIKSLYDNFNCEVGYSDHSANYIIPSCAVLCGASVIEVHFAITKNDPDYTVSLFDTDLKRAISYIRKIEILLGNGEFGIKKGEQKFLEHRRITDEKGNTNQ